jgi:hypothetical protein
MRETLAIDTPASFATSWMFATDALSFESAGSAGPAILCRDEAPVVNPITPAFDNCKRFQLEAQGRV